MHHPAVYPPKGCPLAPHVNLMLALLRLASKHVSKSLREISTISTKHFLQLPKQCLAAVCGLRHRSLRRERVAFELRRGSTLSQRLHRRYSPRFGSRSGGAHHSVPAETPQREADRQELTPGNRAREAARGTVPAQNLASARAPSRPVEIGRGNTVGSWAMRNTAGRCVPAETATARAGLSRPPQVTQTTPGPCCALAAIRTCAAERRQPSRVGALHPRACTCAAERRKPRQMRGVRRPGSRRLLLLGNTRQGASG